MLNLSESQVLAQTEVWSSTPTLVPQEVGLREGLETRNLNTVRIGTTYSLRQRKHGVVIHSSTTDDLITFTRLLFEACCEFSVSTQ